MGGLSKLVNYSDPVLIVLGPKFHSRKTEYFLVSSRSKGKSVNTVSVVNKKGKYACWVSKVNRNIV